MAEKNNATPTDNSAETKNEEFSTEQKQEQTNEGGGLTSPEGILMLCVAGILDGIGFLLLCFALDDCGILDIFGMLIMGGWLLSRGNKGGVMEAGKKGLKRFGVTTLIEIVPYLGGICPSWIILVWKELK
jgi:hypothetical protein